MVVRSLIVVGGPNGAGKSTTAPDLVRDSLNINEFVNADVIAQGLSAFAPEVSAFAAGRIMLKRLRELAKEHRSFAFETTLASRSFAPWLSTQPGGRLSHIRPIPLPALGRRRHGASGRERESRWA